MGIHDRWCGRGVLFRYVASASAISLIAGCASAPMGENELAAVQAQAQAQTFQIDCPAGCKISYRDPSTPTAIPRSTNGWDAAISMTNAVTGVVGAAVVPAAMGYMAIEGFKALKGSGAVDNSVAGNVNTGNSGRIDSADDYTSTPTVVDQPAPVIVTQPPAQIVTQPPPVIVEQPAPVVVTTPEPTVVNTPSPQIVNPVVVQPLPGQIVDPVIVTQPDPIIVQPIIVDQPVLVPGGE